MRKKLPEPIIRDRWSEGIDHEDASDRLVQLIADMDFQHFDDYFC